MNSNKIYERKTFVLLLVLTCLLFVHFTAINSNFIINNPSNDIVSEDVKELIEKENETPKSAEYSNNQTGTGETDLDVDLYQSVLNNTQKDFANLDISNTFTEPFPREGDFKNVLTNISIDNIYAPNKTLIVENGETSNLVTLGNFYASFVVKGDCWLENISVLIRTTGVATTFTFDIFAAKQDGSYIKYDTSKDLTLGSNLGTLYNNSVTRFWYNLTNRHVELDVDNTVYINTSQGRLYYFFIQAYTTTSQGRWYYEPEENNGGNDDNIVWDGNSGIIPEIDNDLTLKVGISPNDHTPSPTEIGMKVNGTAVGDIADTQGYWNKTTPYTTNSDTVKFNITANWYDVSCRVSQVKINYTDTMNLKATSTFNASLEKTNIEWNVTCNNPLNYFDSRIDNYSVINFTIPSNWIMSSVKVWNGSNSFSHTTINLGNGYTKVKVLNAGNGTRWYLTANSTNMIGSIKTYVDLTETDIAFYLDDVQINATFLNWINQNDGDINMSIYNFESPYHENHSVDLTNFIGGTEINVDIWHVQNNIDNYGPLKVQVFWKNDTAAGIKEIFITIIGNTDIETTIPKTEFDNGERFNITVGFDDIGQISPIYGAQINYSIQGSPLRWDNVKPIGNGDYNITIYCNDTQFGGYGQKYIVVYANKTYYTNQTEQINIFIGARTDLDILNDGGKTNFDSNEIFNITVQYNDTEADEGIPGATINYTLNGGANWRYDNVHYFSEGRYNITVYCNDTDFGEYGTFSIVINTSKETYLNQSTDLTPITITITGVNELDIESPSIDSMFFSTETFNITANFEDTSRNEGINDASIISVYVDGSPYTPMTVHNYGEGYYNFTIDSSDIEFSSYGFFTIEIVINKTNYANDTASIEVFIVGDTDLTVLSPPENSEIIIGSFFDIKVVFDDVLLTPNITDAIINYTIDGTNWRYNNIQPNGDGTYNITINSNDPQFSNYGAVVITINASKYKYENQSIDFTILRQSPTTVSPSTIRNFGSVFRGDNRSYTFNYTDNTNLPLSGASITSVGSLQGFTWAWINKGDGNYTISVNSTKVQAREQEYILQFKISITGNQSQIIEIRIIVLLPRTSINNLVSNIVDQVVPEGFNLIVNFTFWDAYHDVAILTITFQNITVWDLNENENWTRGFGYILIHIGSGKYMLNISTYGLAKGGFYSLLINITYTSPNPGPYNYTIQSIQFYYASVSAPSVGDDDDGGGGGTTVTGFTWGDILLWIIIAICVGGGIAAIVGIKKGVIAPKKRARDQVLREVTTIFDDAVNLEHLLVIYKNMGACIFFKSFGLEQIDPQLVSGFLSAVSSFGREMDSQEALNEIQYGDKMLLLADGQYIRVALVLDKQASTILRQHLKEFIEIFENAHSNDLPNWRGKIDVFRNTGDLVDNKFHTSIILPHEIKYELSKVKALEIPSSREVLKVAQGLVEGSERKFFFIASLLMEAVDKIGRDKAEIFMGIKELTENGVLVPIRIAAIEEKEVSQQELNLIRQRVCELPGLTEEEIKNLTSDLAKLNPVEREAYLTSCKEKAKIVSAPVKSKSGAKIIDNVKSAKKEINNLKKLAVEKIKQGDITKAIEIYRSASVIATNWDLTKEFEELEDTVRVAQIDGLKELKRILENEARTAEKGKNYKTAVEKYHLASKAASEIFKLGITEMTKEVKRLTKKAKELEKSI